MKKPVKVTALTVLTIACLSASANDITSNTADLYIRVSKKADLRKFELCSKSGGPASCHPLGYHAWYKASELDHQRTIEQWQAAGATVGAAAATALACLTGGSIVAMVGATANGAIATAVQIGAVTATTGAAGTAASFMKLGPVEQFKQQYLLRSEVIDDGDVAVNGKDDRDIQDIAVRLEELLHKLD